MSQRASAGSSWLDAVPLVGYEVVRPPRPPASRLLPNVDLSEGRKHMAKKNKNKSSFEEFCPLRFNASCSAGFELQSRHDMRHAVVDTTQHLMSSRCGVRQSGPSSDTSGDKTVIIQRLSGYTSASCTAVDERQLGLRERSPSKYAVTGPEIKHNK